MFGARDIISAGSVGIQGREIEFFISQPTLDLILD